MTTAHRPLAAAMRKKQTTTDAPASVPAVVVAPRADWSDWSADHERRRIEAEIEERQKVIDAPIYPREIARKMAEDAARTTVPDWKLFRQEHRALFVKLLRDQPGLQQREVRQLDSLLNLIRDNLPAHLQPLLHDLRTILELRLLAHEGAAFLVGVETGRVIERQHTDHRGRTRTRANPTRNESRTENRLRLSADDPDPSRKNPHFPSRRA